MLPKIDTGFIFKTPNLNTIHNKINKFRLRIHPIILEKVYGAFAYVATNVLDLYTVGLDHTIPAGVSPYSCATEIISLRVGTLWATGIRDPNIDFACTIMVIPVKNKVFGILYTEHSDIANIFMDDTKFVEPYIYWEKEIKPDFINEKEWSKRNKQWSVALKNFNGIPSLNGFSAECVSRFVYLLHSVDGALDHIPDFNTRVYDMCMRLVAYDKKDDVVFAKNYDGFLKWIKTPEGMSTIEDKKNMVETSLIKNIDKNILTNRIK